MAPIRDAHARPGDDETRDRALEEERRVRIDQVEDDGGNDEQSGRSVPHDGHRAGIRIW